jgi:hypothetical protein
MLFKATGNVMTAYWSARVPKAHIVARGFRKFEKHCFRIFQNVPKSFAITSSFIFRSNSRCIISNQVDILLGLIYISICQQTLQICMFYITKCTQGIHSEEIGLSAHMFRLWSYWTVDDPNSVVLILHEKL